MNPLTSPDNQFNSENQTGKSDRFIRDRFLVYHSLSDYSMAFETAVSVQVTALVFRLSLCYIKNIQTIPTDPDLSEHFPRGYYEKT